MEDDQPKRLFDRLSAAGQQVVPVHYRFLHRPAGGDESPTRLAESRPYRSKGFFCWGFHKPISKVLPPR